MAEVKLAAQRRNETGKGFARRTRADGRVPAVLYGRGGDAMHLSVDRREFITALQTDAGMNVLMELQIDGSEVLALTKDLQRDPVRGTVLHADFVRVDRSQQVEVEVPVHLVGEAPGAKQGGVLEHPLFTVHVRCRVDSVPESVDADISAMEIGDTLRVAELRVPEGAEVLNDAELPVVHIAAAITDEQLAAMEAAAVPEAEAAAEGAEPEGAEPEGAAEGEASPAEGEAAPAE